jgi:hypothetical protein
MMLFLPPSPNIFSLLLSLCPGPNDPWFQNVFVFSTSKGNKYAVNFNNRSHILINLFLIFIYITNKQEAKLNNVTALAMTKLTLI